MIWFSGYINPLIVYKNKNNMKKPETLKTMIKLKKNISRGERNARFIDRFLSEPKEKQRKLFW